MRNLALMVIGLSACCSSALAATRTWPTTAPCNTGTLQACITGAATGDTVRIATDSSINEDISISRSLHLVATPGFKPLFSDSRSIVANGSSGELVITYRGLTLQGGALRVNASGIFLTTVVIEDNLLLEGSDPSGSHIRVERTTGASLDYRISRNRIEVGAGSVIAGAIAVDASGPSDGRIDFNEVVGSGNSSGAGIRIRGVPTANFETRIHNNRVVGNFSNYAFNISLTAITPTLPSTTKVHLISNQVSCRRGDGIFPHGMQLAPGSGHLDIYVVNNTIVNCHSGIHIIDSTTPGGSQSVDGVLQNNLVAFNDAGIFLNPAYRPTVDGRYNLLYANGSNQLPNSNVGQINANPRIHNFTHPWPIAGSPAIDAGEAVAAQIYILVAEAPQLDANGLRRTIGAGTYAVDIGAFEIGDRVFASVKTGGGASNNYPLAHPATVGNEFAYPQLSKAYNPGGVPGATNLSVIGAWWNLLDWRPYKQDLTAMANNSGFHVLSAGRNGAFGVNKVHVATAGNISGHYTTISDTFLNGTDDALLMATSNFSGSGVGVYNDHPIATTFICFGGPGPDCWAVMNLDGEAMPVDASFNLFAQPLSPNAFVHTASSWNSSNQYTYIDHPLLNGTPCAAPVVSEKLTALEADGFDLIYSSSRQSWAVYNQSGGSIIGKQFYVLVDPKQVDECLNGMFSDGFE